MNFLRKLLPDDPTECKNYLSPSTCLTLDNEISGILWVCYYFIFITRILPGGIQFEIHVNVNEEGGDRPDELNVAGAADGVQEDESGTEDTDEDDELFQALPFHLLLEDDEDDSSSDDSSDDDETHVNIDVSLRVVT